MAAQPPHVADHLIVDQPAEHILRLTLNRPDKLNAMHNALEDDIGRVLDWFETESSLWVCILTGKGRAFCAGQDLTDWRKRNAEGTGGDGVALRKNGFGSVSRRNFTKPIIGALNGACFGGGLEMACNLDLLVAGESVKLGYPEVLRGVVAAQGGIPRLVRIVGQRLASEMLLLGRAVGAREARDRFGLVNVVVADDEVQNVALSLAEAICSASPDAVQATKLALEDAWRSGCAGVERSTTRVSEHPISQRVYTGQNIREGLAAFAERRAPRWTNPEPIKAKL